MGKKAVHGEKMIEVKVRFFTDHIASGSGMIEPKHAWARGMVRICANQSHGITPGKSVPFNSLAEIPSAIERILIQEKVSLSLSPRMEKYVE